MTRNPIDQVPRMHVLGAVALAVGMFFAVHVLFPAFASQPAGVAVAREAVLLALSAALLVYATRIERLPPAAIGLRRIRLAAIAWGIALCFALVAASAVTLFAAHRLGLQQDTRVLAALAGKPAWLIVLIALTAGISEEIAFRAILVDHFGTLLRSRAAGAIASALLFAAFHVQGWGTLQFFFVLPSAAILTLFWLWKRDLAACIVGHALTDTIGLTLASLARHQ